MFKRLSKLLAFALVAAMMLSILASCGDREDSSSSDVSDNVSGGTINSEAAYNAKVVGNDYLEFGSVPIGGGGYVIGMLIHPKDPSVRYIRTDVGGAYRWEAETETWIPITNSFSSATYYGIGGMGLDPNNPDVVYINCGDGQPCDLFKSTDRGETWERTLLLADVNGNGEGKTVSDSIVVDPNNSNVVYVGTLNSGLHVSYEAGAPKSWQKTSLPYKSFVHSVCVDPTSMKDGRSQTIYAVAYTTGLFRSRDGAQTWEKVTSIPDDVIMIRIDKQGRLYCLTPKKFLRLDKNGSVVDLTPELPDRKMACFGIDDARPNRIAITFATTNESTGAYDPMQLPIYYTNDGGSNWENVNGGTRNNMIPWWPSYYFSSATCTLVFEPDDSKSMWFTDWYGCWYTPDVEAGSARQWYTKEKGHEEMVTLGCLTMPTGTRTFFGQADNSVLVVDEFGTYPEIQVGGATTFDYCAKKPEFVASAGTSSNYSDALASPVYCKNIYEENFHMESTSWNAESMGSCVTIAVCADTPSIMVVLSANQVPRYTRNMGRTWQTSVGAPKISNLGNWTTTNSLASDKVQGNVFYLSTTRGFYRSDDWGATWQLVNDKVKAQASSSGGDIEVFPDKAGHLWVSCGSRGLFYSTDFGATFTEVEGVNGAIALGKGKVEGQHALYVLGTIGSLSKALYRTEDMGTTFYRVNDEKHLLAKSGTVFGDMRFYGRVYIGSSGCGWYCTSAKSE